MNLFVVTYVTQAKADRLSSGHVQSLIVANPCSNTLTPSINLRGIAPGFELSDKFL